MVERLTRTRVKALAERMREEAEKVKDEIPNEVKFGIGENKTGVYLLRDELAAEMERFADGMETAVGLRPLVFKSRRGRVVEFD